LVTHKFCGGAKFLLSRNEGESVVLTTSDGEIVISPNAPAPRMALL
jgi:formylmethanofuran dehydrogenase subunit D